MIELNYLQSCSHISQISGILDRNIYVDQKNKFLKKKQKINLQVVIVKNYVGKVRARVVGSLDPGSKTAGFWSNEGFLMNGPL